MLYVQTFSGTWAMDDYSVIVNNTDIRSIGNFLVNTFPGRPLREISYLFDYALFGLDPWGYHFQNIFWHALNCWLVYLVAIKLNLSVKVAWLSSLLFLVHPIHVEVVANSSHRKDSLALAFLLMALLSYIKIFEQKSTLHRWMWLVCSLILWITAFFAKGNSLVFPIIAMAYEYALVPEDKRLIVRWKQMVPVLCISSLVGLVPWYFYISTLPSFKIAIIGAFAKTENLAVFSLTAYILMLLKSVVFMFLKLLVPLNLSMEYIYTVPVSFLDFWVLSSLILIPAVCFFTYKWKKTSPTLFFLLTFAVILWLPTANIVWHFSYFAADRYMYAPSAGLCILAVLISEQTFIAVRRYVIFLWLFIFCLCATLSWKQASIWNSEMTLYSNMLKISPRSLEAMVGLSNAYFMVKNYDISAQYARQAIERDFTDFRPLITLGSIYDEQGKSDLAIELFKTALIFRPDHFQTHTNLGVAYERANNLQEAESALNKALEINSNHIPAWFNLGVVRYRKNDRHGAKLAFSEVIQRDASHLDALTNLSVVCKEIGDESCYGDAERRLRLLMPGRATK
ncbi:MAG: tetratricopeptide repeat protein [Desulfuromonadales bacterium]